MKLHYNPLQNIFLWRNSTSPTLGTSQGCTQVTEKLMIPSCALSRRVNKQHTVTSVVVYLFSCVVNSVWTKRKMHKKKMQEGRKRWKGKASLMFPAKIFRLLSHDVSPCPANAHSTRVVFLLCCSVPRFPLRGARRSWQPYLTRLNFLCMHFLSSLLLNNLGKGIYKCHTSDIHYAHYALQKIIQRI